MNSEEVKLEIERRIEEGKKKLFDDVAAQLEKEKEAALNEARQKEVSIFELSCLYAHACTHTHVRGAIFWQFYLIKTGAQTFPL